MSNKHHERPAHSGNGESATQAKASEAESRPQSEGEAGLTEAGPTGTGVENEALQSRVKELEAQVNRLGEEASSLKDQYLRSLADYENFRKRMFREREEQQKYANFGLLSDLVPLLDDFDRAIASAEHAQDYQTLHDGIIIIRRQIASVLESKYGLARYESTGKPFDPHVHEAVASEMGEVEEPEVALEFLPGYRLHDRVVRSAKVRVRMPAPTPSSNNASATKASEATVQDEGAAASGSGT
ncbi:MAG TPA: nucleotide exchange factor GrpE [Rectinemataceae bacterium]|nr:nucleotide exchange factor GrpE [Rectinemataceae bacterium]